MPTPACGGTLEMFCYMQNICEGGGGSVATGDYSLVAKLLDSVSSLAKNRILETASAIAGSVETIAQHPSFAADCLWLMQLVLDQHLDLLFHRHLSSLMACCVYSVARAHQAPASFKSITDAMLKLFPHHSLDAFQKVEMQMAADNTEAVFGDTRQLYNQIFLPRMESALLERFPGMNSSSQDNASIRVKVTAAHAMRDRRPPLQKLSAAALNTRAGRFQRMQA